MYCKSGRVKCGAFKPNRKPSFKRNFMKKEVKLGLLATLKAKAGKEDEVEQFLKSALPLAAQESGTVVWFALRLDSNTFGIFDAFADEAGRDAHLSGPIAAALMAKWKDLLSEPPAINKVDVLAAKLVS
jgi:quinol monooxygenase YgiN